MTPCVNAGQRRWKLGLNLSENWSNNLAFLYKDSQSGSFKCSTERPPVSMATHLLWRYDPSDPFFIRPHRVRLRRLENKAATAGKAQNWIHQSAVSFHLPPESAERPAVAAEHLSRVKYIPEETAQCSGRFQGKFNMKYTEENEGRWKNLIWNLRFYLLKPKKLISYSNY